MDARQWAERNVCYLYANYCESSKTLEGDYRRDNAAISIRSHTRNCFFKQKSFLQILQARWHTGT